MNKKRISLKNFNNFNSNSVQVDKFYNYLPSKSLKNSVGVKCATFPINETSEEEYSLNFTASGIEKVNGIAYFKQYFKNNGTTTHRLLIHGGDDKIYINQMLDDSSDLFWLYGLKFDSSPITLAYKKNDEDAIILASKNEMKIWKTGYSPYTISNVPIITSMCFNEGVLFCTISDPAFKIWYATDLDAENIGNISANSGYISLEDDLGDAKKIIALEQSVFVFRDYGITKINFYKSSVSVTTVYSSNTKIYSESIAVCGNTVIFVTNQGLYSFNGVKVNLLNVDLKNYNCNYKNSVASSLQNKYYLALNVDYSDSEKMLCENVEHVNNTLIVVDIETENYEIVRGVDIKSFLPVKTNKFEKMLVTFNSVYTDIIGEISSSSTCLEDNLPKFWLSKDLTIDTCAKLFTKLSVDAEVGIKFKLIFDNNELSFTTYKNGLNEFMFKICCKQIKLEISSPNKSAEVNQVSLEYYDC